MHSTASATVPRPGHDDHRDVGVADRGLLQDLQGPHHRHLQVAEDHVHRLGGQLLQGLLAVGGGGHPVALALSAPGRSPGADHLFVIHHQDRVLVIHEAWSAVSSELSAVSQQKGSELHSSISAAEPLKRLAGAPQSCSPSVHSLFPAPRAGDSRGRIMVKVVPPPGAASALMVPPCRWMTP